MKRSREFHDYVITDLLGDIKGISSRPMFSGFGIYKDGIIFALIAENTLYFKVDASNKARFENHGSKPFSYKHKNGKVVTLSSYWELPAEIMENSEKLSEWVEISVAVSCNQ